MSTFFRRFFVNYFHFSFETPLFSYYHVNLNSYNRKFEVGLAEHFQMILQVLSVQRILWQSSFGELCVVCVL